LPTPSSNSPAPFTYDAVADWAASLDWLCPICGARTLDVQRNGDGSGYPVCHRDGSTHEEDGKSDGPCEPDDLESAYVLDTEEPPSVRPADRGAEILAVRASDVEPASVGWLWAGWIPLGMQTALVGMPGQGKSTLSMKVAADVTTGRLDGDLLGKPAAVLIVSYEDVINVRLRPMAEAADADLDLLHFLTHRDTGNLIDLTRHLSRIEELVRRHEARLLVIDPLVAGLPHGKVDSHRDQSVRSVLAPVAALAEECGPAILTTGHFSKNAMSALLGTGGSIGFVGAPRSILAFGPDPRDDRGGLGRGRVLAHAKCNVGRMQQSREVGILPHYIDPFGRNIETSRAVIGGEVETSADDLVQPARGGSARVQAERFLRELLTDGPHKAEEVINLAADDDISKRTLDRAKRDLGVRVFQRDRAWWWELPSVPEGEAEETDE
jgi:hypothetical protein